FMISNKKKHAKVKPINKIAYLMARSLFTYWSTGSIKLTPNCFSPKPIQLFLLAHCIKSSCILVAKNDVCQLALNPLSLIVESAGRKLPTNFGCGQSDMMFTCVSLPIGIIENDSVPVNFK